MAPGSLGQAVLPEIKEWPQNEPECAKLSLDSDFNLRRFLGQGRWGFPHQSPPGVNLTPFPRLLTRWNFPRPRQDLFRDCLQELPGPPLRLRPLYLEDFWLGMKNDKSQLYSLEVSAPTTPLKK